MDEGLVLQAVSDEFAERPPALVGVAQAVEFRGDVGEVEAESVDEERLALTVRDEYRLRELALREAHGEAPRQEVMAGFSPDAALVGLVGLAPEGPDSAHDGFLIR